MRRTLALLLLLLLVTGIAPVLAQNEVDTGWDADRRFTVLVMGMDRRPDNGDTLQVRTDAMILVSIDPASGRVGALHVPRDLHMSPPQVDDLLRVNTLVLYGEMLQEGYGPYYAMDTLQYNLGMYIDRFMLFDFDAFEALINAIGGIEITTTYTIDDPTFPDDDYGFDPFYLPAGTHILDGHEALQFARTRHGDDDFIRGRRQLQVVEATLTRLREDGVLLSLIPQAPQLIEDLAGTYYTDLTLDEMIDLALYAAALDLETLATATIDGDYLSRTANRSGRLVYIPNRATLVDLLTEIFGPNYNQ